MVFVGGSVAVSGVLAAAPLATLQSLRYAVASLLLVGYARVFEKKVERPRGREWLWLLGVTGAGLVLFNIALVEGSKHAEPAVLGVAVACVPIVLAALGTAGRRTNVLSAAVVVTAGAILVEGAGRADATGIAWAVVTFACEAGFTLLAVPLLGRLGPVGVSVHTTWLAGLIFGAYGVVAEGPAAILTTTGPELLAAAYLAVGVTACAFVLWYTAVEQLGAGRAGLLTGIAPIAAAGAGVALGEPLPGPLVWAGIALVAIGLAAGMPVRRGAAALAGTRT
ncbi:membrane protein [Actinoplanes sp. NBRC 103695]|nr:membrane protein [Actinoplanes sp. NBRC 103695]